MLLLALFAYLPQWKKAVIQFRVTGKGTALIFSSLISLIFVFITVCLIAFYRKGDRDFS